MTRRTSKRPKIEEIDEALREIPADRPGLPARDSIVGVDKLVSPGNKQYTIIHTTETDAYDPPLEPKPRRRRRKP